MSEFDDPDSIDAATTTASPPADELDGPSTVDPEHADASGGVDGGVAARLRNNTFLRHVLTLMSGTVVAQAIPIIFRPFLTRIYNPEQYGTFALWTSVAAAFSTIGALRYDLAVVMPESESDGRALVKLASRISLVVSVLVTAGLWIFSGPISDALKHPSIRPYLPLAGALVFALTQLSSRQYWLNRRKRYKEMARNRVGQSAFSVGGQLGMGVAGLGVTGLCVGYLVGQVFSMTNLFRLTRHETRPQPGDSALAMAREYKKMPLVNGPNAVVDTIRLNGINMLVSRFFSGAVLGQFNQAWTLLSLPEAVINGAMTQVFYQRLSVTKRGEMFGVVRNAIIRSLLVGIIPFGLIWLLSPSVFPLFLGGRWGVSGQIARRLVPWLYLNFATAPVSLLFLTVRRQGVMFVFACVYMVVPLSILWFHHQSIYSTIQAVALAMAGLLTVFLGLALIVAKQYDNGFGERVTA